MISVSVQHQDFDCGAEQAKIAAHGGGALASFSGLVRAENNLSALEIEHYPAMTEAALQKIATSAAERWSLTAVNIIHRTGKLPLGAQIVFVATTSDHRRAAFESCAYIMDRLKTDAPFWKKNHYEDGSADWVEARSSDAEASRNWDID